MLSIVLSSLRFDYFFAPPLYSLNLTPADIPAIVVLISFARWLRASLLCAAASKENSFKPATNYKLKWQSERNRRAC